MKTYKDNVLIQVTDTQVGKIKYKGLELDFVPDYDPIKNAQTFGQVIAVPKELTDKAINYSFKGEIKMSDIGNEVEVGDKIYFLHSVLGNADQHEVKKGVYAVPYDRIVCAIRGEEIVMIGSNVLLEPFFEEEDDIKKNGIYIKQNPDVIRGVGRVRAIGSSLEGEESIGCRPGDIVLVETKFRKRNFFTVEGEDYWLHQQRHLAGIFPDEETAIAAVYEGLK